MDRIISDMECARTVPPAEEEAPEMVVMGPTVVLGELVAAAGEGEEEEERGEDTAEAELLLGVPKLRAVYRYTCKQTSQAIQTHIPTHSFRPLAKELHLHTIMMAYIHVHVYTCTIISV